MLDQAGSSVISTGVEGLDDVLNGGLPKGFVYLLEGQPGTGKTTLSWQFLLAGAEHNDRLLYITLSQTELELRDLAASHGFPTAGIQIVELVPSQLAREAAQAQTVLRSSDVELEAVARAIERVIEQVQPDRLVFDSLVEIQLMSSSELRYRREFLRLRDFLVAHNATVLLVDTILPNDSNLMNEALVHGVIRVEWTLPPFGVPYRRIAVTKVRGRSFTEGYHDLTLQHGGMVVHPRLIPDVGPDIHIRKRISTGIAGLDELSGGGLDSGTTTLITGFTGTGKSTLATWIAWKMAREGDHAALFLFEERADTLLGRMHGLGVGVGAEDFPPNLAVQPYNPAEVRPGQLFQDVQEAVERGVRVVVIDSLSGFLATFPRGEDLMVQFHALLGYLGRNDVMTLLVLNRHGTVNTHSDNETDVSFIADSVILLSQQECDGGLERTITMLKKRTGDHSTQARGMRFTRKGIEVYPLRQIDRPSVYRQST